MKQEKITEVKAQAFTVPTDLPEADGTLSWQSTTLVLVTVKAATTTGIGYTYADATVASFINQQLKKVVEGQSAYEIPMTLAQMSKQIRNNGHCGMAMMAVSAVDNALWDLKAKMLQLPLCKLLGQARKAMLVYGSGGFTSYTNQQLQEQLSNWVKQGIKSVKIKVGAEPQKDNIRIATARKAIGDDIDLLIDANGAFTAKQSLYYAEQWQEHKICWFEEPVSSDDGDGLCFMRQHAPSGMQIAAGEYGYNLTYFKNLLEKKSVDVLQADATRCGGISNFLKTSVLCDAYHIPFSSHCAPSIHLHAALAAPSFYIAEYFHDHVRIESMLFDGFRKPENGYITPDLSRPGLGLEFKFQDAAKYKII